MEKRGSGHVCIYVCMFFEDFSRLRAFTEPKVVPYGGFVGNTLLRHVLSAVASLGERGT